MVCFRQPQGGDAVSALDVLAANVAVANTARQNDRYTSIVTCADCMMEAREALAAIAELIEAANRAHMALIGYLPAHRNAVTDEAIAKISAALARVGGAA